MPGDSGAELPWATLLSEFGYEALALVWGFDATALRSVDEVDRRRLVGLTIEWDEAGRLPGAIDDLRSLEPGHRLDRLLEAVHDAGD